MNSYHRNSLSKEQLEAIVSELQKKVKVLQQRHRRHLEKLLGLENTVSQLRQSNMLNEERLQLLERVKSFKYLHEVIPDYLFPVKQSAQSEMTRGRHWTHPGENTVKMWNGKFLFACSRLPQAYIQTSAAVSDAGETVAIIYEEDDAAYLYTPLNNVDEKLWGRTDCGRPACTAVCDPLCQKRCD